ncbi:hypothetical protein OS965_29990 [Streptomyces sp. H27-G5]|uniref:hypothetical protein n=1 Tax=Streptomyces sp. H27-G5 TaxID=2996698 RepID=UPI00226D6879|nr:hypothetical protein [Streptomyces sp. H27-G5]MCY0922342.1 hypothetical protein [Streptomyces sp. H27-G5]
MSTDNTDSTGRQNETPAPFLFLKATPEAAPAEPDNALGAFTRSLRTAMRRWYGIARPVVGQWLEERAEDLRDAFRNGWDETTTWIKATVGATVLLAVAAVAVMCLALIAQSAVDGVNALAGIRVPEGSGGRTGLLASITTPVWTYLQSHTAGLAVSAPTAYGTWILTALATGLLSFVTRAFGARLAWGATGAATGWMVWQGAPADGREVALGITVIAFALLSIPALRGFRIRGY